MLFVDREGLGVYDRLEQGVCIAWALFGNVLIDQTSVIINTVHEEAVNGELFASRSQLCYRKQ